MTTESILQTCLELGIELSLKGDAADRLQVDAPKGALSPSLRELLVANKSELIAFSQVPTASSRRRSLGADETVAEHLNQQVEYRGYTLMFEQPQNTPPQLIHRR